VKASFLGPLLRGSSPSLVIRNNRSQRHLADHLIGAFDSRTRRTGLLRHESLPAGHAMLIAPTNAVHTFFMRFAIDIVFVTREGRVLKTCAAVRPWRIAAALGGYAVIELPAGALATSDTEVGDMLVIVPGEQV
jgi:uncharacterized membrane protein (UPF0127 family)